MKTNPLIALIFGIFIASGCRYELVEDVVITRADSPKSAAVEIPGGKEVEGNTYYPYLIGYNLKDSIDEAFENAGEEYDLLVNAKIDVKYYYVLIYFSKYVIVTGTAAKSSELIAKMGEEGYRQWLASQNVVARSAATE